MSRSVRMAVIACGLLVIGGTVAWASGLVDPVWVGSNGTIAACVQNDSGNLRLIDPSSKRQDIDSCRKGETRISFNQKGQQGAPGPQGPQGPAGTLPGPANVTVNCSQGQTIDGALAANAAATSVQITVQGTCTESVGINQDNVTLQAGSAGAGIQAPSANQDVIDINDARHVMVQGLTLTGGNAGINASGGDFQANDLHITDASNGVNAGGEAFGYLTNVSIDGCNDGVNAGAAEIGVTGGSITGCQGFGVIAQDGGSVILNGGATVTAARQDVVAQYGGTVEIGDATISNATNTDVFAFGGSITVAGSGTLVTGSAFSGVAASDGGNAAVENGAVVSGNNGGVSADSGGHLLIQDGGIVENNNGVGVSLRGASSLRMRGAPVVQDNTGDGIHLSDASVAELDASDVVTGNGGYGIVCDGLPSVAVIRGNPGTVSGNVDGQIACQSAGG